MTAWTDIPDSMIQQGKPIRATDGRALRDNPAAIAAGADGAPRVQGIALGGVYLGRFTQIGKNPEPLVGLDKVGLLMCDFVWSGGATLQIGLSTNGGASYGSWINLFTIAGGTVNMGKIHFDFVNNAWRSLILGFNTSTPGNSSTIGGSGSLSLAGVNAIRLTKNSDYVNSVHDWFVLGARD